MAKYVGTDNLEVMTEAINYNDFLNNLIRKNTSTSENILDFGAGVGTFAIYLNKMGYNVSCLEPDAGHCDILKNLKLTAFKSIEKMKSDEYDFVYSLNVIEHIKDDLKAINELKTKIKKNGKLLIFVPAFNILYSSMDKKVGHYRRYTLKSLKDVVTKSGYDVIKANYVDSAGYFASLLFKYMGNGDGSLNVKALIFYDRIIFPISLVFDKLFCKLFGKNAYVLARKK